MVLLMNKYNVENQPKMSDAELLADRVASKIVNVPNIIYAVGVANLGSVPALTFSPLSETC